MGVREGCNVGDESSIGHGRGSGSLSVLGSHSMRTFTGCLSEIPSCCPIMFVRIDCMDLTIRNSVEVSPCESL